MQETAAIHTPKKRPKTRVKRQPSHPEVLFRSPTCSVVGCRYRGAMPELVPPTRRLHTAWLEAHAEWGHGIHEDGFGLLQTDKVDSPAGFEAWVARLADESGRCSYRWIIDGGDVLGGIALRHEAHGLVARAGHIGFGIRPSARRRGLAAWALGRMLGEAKLLGMDRVLVMCAAGNVASARTIESQGGALAELGNVPEGSVWRYCIQL